MGGKAGESNRQVNKNSELFKECGDNKVRYSADINLDLNIFPETKHKKRDAPLTPSLKPQTALKLSCVAIKFTLERKKKVSIYNPDMVVSGVRLNKTKRENICLCLYLTVVIAVKNLSAFLIDLLFCTVPAVH